jgi:2-keto-4-pentenoate hydratase
MDAKLRELARRMLIDNDARTPNQIFRQPLTLTIDEAYQLQGEIGRLREQRGEKIIGYKVGCISAVIQQQLGISEPIFGRLFDTECHSSGARLSCANYANLAIEGEIAVRLREDVPATLRTDEDYLNCIDELFPVVELHHYVFHSPEPSCQELIASNGMHAGFVVAESATRMRGTSNPGLTVSISNGDVDTVEEASAVARPMESLRWLASRLAMAGVRLSGGQVILTGSSLKLFPVKPGMRVVVEAESIGKSSSEFVP